MGSFFSKPISPKQEKPANPSEEKAYLITHDNCITRMEQMMMLKSLHPDMRSFLQYDSQCNEIAIVFFRSGDPSISTFEEIKQMAKQQDHHIKQLPNYTGRFAIK